MDFRIVEEPGHDKVNPFKQYQRKRGGKVGQIFEGAIVKDGDAAPIYAGELMLAGWGDTSDKGQTVRFWLDDEAGLHPFAGLTRRTSGQLGAMFAGVLVLCGEGAANGVPGVDASSPQKQRPLSSVAHLLITSPRFLQWLNEKSTWTEKLHKAGRIWDAETSRNYVKHTLGIESLRELDQVPAKAEAFHEVFRRQFVKWDGRE